MGKLVNSTYVTLDGVIQDPQDWPSLGSFSGDGGKLQLELLLHSDAVLMGRHTYEGFVPVWTSMSGDPYSDRINAMPKYVASTTLLDPVWTNTTVLRDNLVERVRELKTQSEGHIVQYGFGQVSYALLQAGLIDELRLWLHPFFLGSGGPAALLYRDSSPAMFELSGSTALDSGVVVLNYRKAA